MDDGQAAEDSRGSGDTGSTADDVLDSRRRELKSLELLLLEKEINSEKRKLEQKIAERKKALIASDGDEESTQDAMIHQWLSKLEMLESQLKDELQQGEETPSESSDRSGPFVDADGEPRKSSKRSRIQIFAEYLKKKGTVRLSVASKEMGWKKSSVETYASVLEHKGYASIKRPFLREPRIVYHPPGRAKGSGRESSPTLTSGKKAPTSAGKGGKPVRGGRMIAPDSEEAFTRIIAALRTDFFGVLRMYGSAADKQFAAGLLVSDGDIIGASLEELSTETVWQGDEAIDGIRHNLAGTKGTLELYAFPPSDRDAILEKNTPVLLASPIALSEFGLTIRGNLAKWAAAQKGFLSGGSLSLKTIVGPWTTSQARESLASTASGGASGPTATLKFKESFDLASFARKAPATVPKGPPASKPIATAPGAQAAGEGDDLRAQRSGQGGKKVRTKLDRMLLIIQKEGMVKMSVLVRELNAPEAKIEEWGRILENGGLITVDIPLMGDPEFRKM